MSRASARSVAIVAVVVTAVAVVVAIAGGLFSAAGGHSPGVGVRRAASDGLRHTSIEVSPGGCGGGWGRPRAGVQVFDLRNTGTVPTEVYLKDVATGAVHGEVEGLAPGATRPLRADLGNGTYAFTCIPDDAGAVRGPARRVTGAEGPGGPAATPVSVHDLIPPTLDYQRWVRGRMGELVTRTDALAATVDRGDLAGARAAWLTAHLVYERMGAAYGTFGDADAAINGTTAGLARGVHDRHFTGFHRVEYGLWHGESAAGLRGPAKRLATDVRALRRDWADARMDPLDVGLRAHEILENTVQFELTGRTDYGSGSNLATARANLDGTRAVLNRLRPLLKHRAPELPVIERGLKRAGKQMEEVGGGGASGRWVPLDRLSRAQRERLNGAFGDLVERLADVAAVLDVRRTVS
ncbi:EfeM/EfeO family lipoprotein [Streptomyces sp. NPDC000151]|uniref:EfeM/EfeO family lipoprotein n=1 Tax=Streptomyces sp. NPDC000151 TaxID=3154244 RepID=UPI00332942A6